MTKDHSLMPTQLTVRACLLGMLLGGFMSLSNLYVALKTGSSVGVSITAGILAFGIFSVLTKLGWVKKEFGMLENNAMQSVASAAGYMTGGGTVAAVGALMMLTGQPMRAWPMFFWITTIAFLGVVTAIPMKQQMINIEKLPFPTGKAAAETLLALHGTGGDVHGSAAILGYSGMFGAVIAFFRDAHARWIPWNIPDIMDFPYLTLAGRPIGDFTVSFEFSLINIGAGAIMGFRAAWSMLLGSMINFCVVAPWLYKHGIISEKLGYRNIVNWSMWFGATCVLTGGLLAFALEWRTVGRAMGNFVAAFRGQKSQEEDGEVPLSWFLIGVAILAPIIVFLQYYLFDIKIWMGALAVVMSFFIAIVACRANGETDVVPTSSLGKITQVTFGIIDPSNVVTNSMTAAVTSGVGLHAADLLTDLKGGYLLGADPKQQFWAQFFGVCAGSVFVVPAFHLLVPTAASIGTQKWPAPGAVQWRGVAEIMAHGLHTLHPSARIALFAGGLVGILLVLLERSFPEFKRYIPLASGLGLGFVIPGSNSISQFVGAFAALLLAYRRPALADKAVVPIASGFIAGESLMGVLIAALISLGFLSS